MGVTLLSIVLLVIGIVSFIINEKCPPGTGEII